MSRIRLLATFHDLDEAHRAAEAVADAVPDAQVRAGDPDDARDALVAGQQAEMDQSAPTVPGGVVTGAQVRGSVLWGVPSLLVGCLLGLAVGLLVPVGGVSRFAVVVASSTAAGGLALSTFGVLMGARGAPSARARRPDPGAGRSSTSRSTTGGARRSTGRWCAAAPWRSSTGRRPTVRWISEAEPPKPIVLVAKPIVLVATSRRWRRGFPTRTG
ncbi:MAG: hypothetical protein R2690_00330 [Acidimicrobiales bacterium]